MYVGLEEDSRGGGARSLSKYVADDGGGGRWRWLGLVLATGAAELNGGVALVVSGSARRELQAAVSRETPQLHRRSH